MQEEKNVHKILAENPLEWNQNVRDDLLNILESIDPRNLEQIVEHISIAFSEIMSDYEVDSELWKNNGITKDNYKKYCSYKVLGLRYFVITNLINGKIFLNKLNMHENKAFFSPKVLAINIAWHGLLLKLIEDYEYPIIQNLFAKREESIKKEKIIWVKWFPEEIKEALLQYKMYILETAKFIVKYKLPTNEDSQAALAKFIEEMKNEVIADLKADQNSKIISEAIKKLEQLPDGSQKSKKKYGEVPSLVTLIFKNKTINQEIFKKPRLQHSLESLSRTLKKPSTEWFHDTNDLIQEFTQAMDGYKALCNKTERKNFERYIEKPIKTILDKFEILASFDDLLTTKKELNYKKEESSTEETKHEGPPCL